ncbi:fumarylacetoacetase [Suillus paluster]|uniref:fumarylacetoacetase n=1 Tax=Suillus paluster TaxID=48578 RepID=UPI001B8657E5|nr:fumarylacetoacetase [Suillus paluster]KAG1740510.1 fumarylacetoacetase [Suillus paluster]
MASQSIILIPDDSPFSLANIPFGIFSTQSQPTPRPGVAIGDHILDLRVLTLEGIFTNCGVSFPSDVFTHTTLNAFAALGRSTTSSVRAYIQSLLSRSSSSPLYSNPSLLKRCTVRQMEATMHLPFDIGDFTDFTGSRTHAKNTHSGHGHGGVDVDMFHPPRAASGRASTILPSGTPIVRPVGHLPLVPPRGHLSSDLPGPLDDLSTDTPIESRTLARTTGFTLAPTNELDVELELAFFVGVPTEHFERVPVEKAEEHIFGVVLLNDWSETLPFGAFNAKNFASTISPWVVTLDALEPFKIAHDIRRVPSYLLDKGDVTYDISVSMEVIPGGPEQREMGVTRSSLRNSYWTFRQMLAFHTLSGCRMRTGDLIGTGTLSGEDPTSLCSLIEQRKHFPSRIFIQDRDEVVFSAWCGSPQGGVGFGVSRGSATCEIVVKYFLARLSLFRLGNSRSRATFVDRLRRWKCALDHVE